MSRTVVVGAAGFSGTAERAKALCAATDEAVDDTRRQFADGLINEHQARLDVCAALAMSPVCPQVAAQTVAKSNNFRARMCEQSLADDLQGIINPLVLHPGGKYSFDLTATGSACGWARQIVRSQAAHRLHTILDHAAIADLFPLVDFTDSDSFITRVLASDANTASQPRNDWMTMVESTFEDRSRNVRDLNAQRLENMGVVNAVVGTPDLVRPTAAVRSTVNDALRADPGLAYASFLWYAGMEPEGATEPDPAVVALWNSFTADDVDRLLAYGTPDLIPDLCSLLALGATDDWPAPGRSTRSKVRRSILALGPSDPVPSQWKVIADNLASSCIASECGAVNGFDNRSSEEKLAGVEAQHRIDRGRYDSDVKIAADYLGITPHQLRFSITQILDRHDVSPFQYDRRSA